MDAEQRTALEALAAAGRLRPSIAASLRGTPATPADKVAPVVGAPVAPA